MSSGIIIVMLFIMCVCVSSLPYDCHLDIIIIIVVIIIIIKTLGMAWYVDYLFISLVLASRVLRSNAIISMCVITTLLMCWQSTLADGDFFIFFRALTFMQRLHTTPPNSANQQ